MIKKYNFRSIVYYAIIALLTVPTYILCFYALPCSDDFITATGIREQLELGETYLGIAWRNTQSYYVSWGGFYFAVFLNFFISPFARAGIWGIRIFICIVHLLWYSSLYWLCAVALRFFFKINSRKQILSIYVLLLFAFTNIEVHVETMTWYTGMVAYVLVVVCMIWGIIFFLNGLESGKLIWIVGASVIGFLVSGGALNIAAMNCGIYLILTLFGCLYIRRKVYFICFGSSLIGALINACAPGNFMRHNGSVDIYQILCAVKGSAFQTWEQLQVFFFETPYMLVLILLLFLALQFKEKGSFQYPMPGIVTGILIIGCIVVNFPVYLGYEGYYPGRCCWVQDCVIFLGTFFVTFYWAGWLKCHGLQVKMSNEFVWYMAICCSLFFCSLGRTMPLDNYPTVNMLKQLTNGNIREVEQYWVSVMDEVEESKERDVVIERARRKSSSYIMDPAIYASKEDYTNSVMAQYYGKDSVILWENQEEPDDE